jgi:hypothetical protein
VALSYSLLVLPDLYKVESNRTATNVSLDLNRCDCLVKKSGSHSLLPVWAYGGFFTWMLHCSSDGSSTGD